MLHTILQHISHGNEEDDNKKNHRESPQKTKPKKNPTKNQDFDLYRLKPSSSSLFIKISEVCSKETVFALLYASFSH